MLQSGRTPLHNAAEGEHKPIIEKLIRHGASVMIKDVVTNIIVFTYMF